MQLNENNIYTLVLLPQLTLSSETILVHLKPSVIHALMDDYNGCNKLYNLINYVSLIQLFHIIPWQKCKLTIG
jgi:hypothetical protein